MGTRIATVLVILFLWVSGAIAAVEKELLYPTVSDKEVEEKLIDYFTEHTSHRVNRKVYNGNDNDVFLSIRFGKKDDKNDLYDIRIIIDTSVSNQDKRTHKVTGRRIKILGLPFSAAFKSINNKQEILRVLNEFSLKYWAPGRVVVDENGDLRLEWSINIAGEKAPVHCEQVVDAVERMARGWMELVDLMRFQNML